MREKKIHVWELPNGFTIYTRYDEISRISGFGVRVGGIYDPPGLTGMSHICEHVFARKSRSYTIDDYYYVALKYLGLAEGVNIITEKTHMFFGHESMIRTDHMLNVVPIMASFVRDHVVDQEGMEIELAAVLQETYEKGLDVVDDNAGQLMLETLYTTNPIRKRLDCEPEELKNFTVQKIRQFGRRYFTPANMFMVMLGPSHERAKNIAYKYFGDLPKGSQPRLDYDHSDDIPILQDVRYAERTFPGIRQIHTTVAWPTVVYGSKDDIALDILARILEYRLTVRLREENRILGNGVYHPAVESEQTFVHGLLQASFATSDPDFAKFGHGTVLQEARRLREELVSVRLFEAAKTYPELCWLDAFRSNPDLLTEMILDSVGNGDTHCAGIHSFQDDLRKLSRKKLRDVANRYLRDEHVYAVVRPE